MDEVTLSQKYKLAELIVEEIKAEFANDSSSGNLVDTLKIYIKPNGNVCVDIPARRYDVNLFKKEGVIVPVGTGESSYASQLDKSGKHRNYAEKCIRRAMVKWRRIYGVKGKIAEFTKASGEKVVPNKQKNLN